MGPIKDGGADFLVRCLANMPGKQTAALIAIEPLWQRTSYVENSLDTRSSSKHAEGHRQRGTVGTGKHIRATGRGGGTVVFQEGCPENCLIFQPDHRSKPKNAFVRDAEGGGFHLRKRGECVPLLGAGLGSCWEFSSAHY